MSEIPAAFGRGVGVIEPHERAADSPPSETRPARSIRIAYLSRDRKPVWMDNTGRCWIETSPPEQYTDTDDD